MMKKIYVRNKNHKPTTHQNKMSTIFTKVLTISIKKFICVSRTLQNELVRVLSAIFTDGKKSKSKEHK